MSDDRDAHDSHPHPPHLAHHFSSAAQQYDSAVQGMWLFLATEILLFGGLFCVYAVFRSNHPEIFEYAHKYLSVPLGATNTAILLLSSFTMAVAVWAAQHSRQRLLVTMLILTLLGGCGFLSIKYVEYEHKWKEGLLWGMHYHPAAAPGEHGEAAPTHSETPPTPAPASAPTSAPTSASQPAAAVDEAWMFEPAQSGPRGLLRPGQLPEVLATDPVVHNVFTFFGVYFALTGLHGLHVIAGLAVIGWILAGALRRRYSAAYSTPVHLVGLYWHVVDLIWIYLFPLLYLIH